MVDWTHWGPMSPAIITNLARVRRCLCLPAFTVDWCAGFVPANPGEQTLGDLIPALKQFKQEG